MTTYTMTAEENYSAEFVAQWDLSTQPNYCFCDKQYIGTSYDRVRRTIVYSAVITDATKGGVFPNFITEANATTHTLWSGLTCVPPGHYIDLSTNFVFQVARKNIDTGVVTFYNAYDAAKTVPATIGAGGITGVSFVAGAGGADGVHRSASLIGGTGTGAYATITIAGGAITSVVLDWGIGFGYTVGDVLTSGSLGAGASITVTSVNTGSDGTWRRSVFDTVLNGGDVDGVVNPRNGDFWVHLQSCELALFRAVDNYASIISPLLLPFAANENADADAWVVGLNADWVYFWSQNIFTTPGQNMLQIVPSAITPAETAADYLLASYTYAYPDDSYYFRQCIGPDGNLYVFGASQTGTRAYKLWKCVPGTGFTDITPWSSSTGPNSNCAGWTTDNTAVPWVKHYLLQLPASNRIVCVSKLFPADYAPTGSDPTRFRVDFTYYALSGGAFDYHEGVVTGYMDAAWASTDLAGAAWKVLDFRELDNDLEASDYLHAYDYTKRWFMFVCNAMAAGAPVDGLNKCVFVQYSLVAGAVPTVVQVVSEQGWDDAYPTYAAAVGQTEVVAASLPRLATASGQARFTNELAEDNGFFDPTGNAFWLSGDNPQLCEFAAEFNGREAQALQTWTGALPGAAAAPFLKLAFSAPPITPNRRSRVGLTYGRIRG